MAARRKPAAVVAARAWRAATMAAVMKPATSMSRFANCAPIKKKGRVASKASASFAAAEPHRRFASNHSASAIAQPPSSGATRADQSFTPSRPIAAASTQYSSGGL